MVHPSPRVTGSFRALAALLVAACSAPPAADKTPGSPAPKPASAQGAAPAAGSEEPAADEESAGDITEPIDTTPPDPEAPLDAASRFEAMPLDDYPLDKIERVIGERGRIACPDVDMVRYGGELIRYQKTVRVYVAFRERLRKFEQVVREVAVEVYGRAPRLIQHYGTYNCRRMRGMYKEFISEHSFANAIDIAAFEFGGANRKQRAAAPKGLRGSFKVTVDRHWHGSKGTAAVHARFLRLLIERLAGRSDIFRVMLGPGYPNHDDHFHLDAAPFRLIDMQGFGSESTP